MYVRPLLNREMFTFYAFVVIDMERCIRQLDVKSVGVKSLDEHATILGQAVPLYRVY